MRPLRVICWIIAVGLLAALLASYGGRLHPIGDSLAVFRPAMAILLALCALCLRGWARLALLVVAMAALLPILWMMRPVSMPQGASLVVYQKNLLFRHGDPTDFLADVHASGADLVLLEELSDDNLPIPKALHNRYPHQLICPAHRVGAVAILSAHPLAAPVCREGSGYAMARVEHPAGAFTAIVVHLHWPWPSIQEPQANAILGEIAGVSRPVVIGGDFNMVAWTGSPRRFARATDTRIAGPLFPTLSRMGYPLPIDHVLVDAATQARVERRPRFGSDHNGVLARIGPFGGR